MDFDEEIPLDSKEERNSYNCSVDDVTTETAAAAAEEEYCNHHLKKDYTVLKEEIIKQLQENDISEVSGVLSVSRGTTCTLLLRQSWKVSSIFEDWFSDEERLRKSVGISSKEISPKPENYCKIFMENVDIETMLFAPCGHLFCSDCWRSHVSISINDGPGYFSTVVTYFSTTVNYFSTVMYFSTTVIFPLLLDLFIFINSVKHLFIVTQSSEKI
ncbi:hypothetical protein C2S52_006092 [Perilla frutescens var. hirtella]|nr:hypothetical protein C2S52_006092 [Perilla frutescens var. hirtella]